MQNMVLIWLNMGANMDCDNDEFPFHQSIELSEQCRDRLDGLLGDKLIKTPSFHLK